MRAARRLLSTGWKCRKVNKTITTVNLRKSEIGDGGAIALAESLKVVAFHTITITMLHLVDSKIGDEGAVALAESLKVNRALKTVFMQ